MSHPRKFNLLYTSGDESAYFQFTNPGEGTLWLSEINELKNGAALICATGNSPEAWRGWLVACRNFRSRWADSKIPYDIRRAWNDAEANALGVAVTVFEPLKMPLP